MRCLKQASVLLVALITGLLVVATVRLFFLTPSVSVSIDLVNLSPTDLHVLVYERGEGTQHELSIQRDAEARIVLYQGDSAKSFVAKEFLIIALSPDLALMATVRMSGAEVLTKKRLVLTAPCDTNEAEYGVIN